MNQQYYPPQEKSEAFHCALCGVYARQSWNHLFVGQSASPFTCSFCDHCKKRCYWADGRMVRPAEAPVPPAHPDLPITCHSEYDEAREIVARSPRGATALLRLCLQILMKEFGEKGENINDDIKSLVAKGLSPVIQQALDVCRVVGNNAVHPGEINLNDTPEIAHRLFGLINFIVEDRITRPSQIQDLYDQLPKKAIEAIEKRDAPKAA